MKTFKPKKCLFCGKEFIPTNGRQIYCDGPHYRICPVCGKEYIEKNNANLKNPPVCCSYECRVKKTKQTSLLKYDITAPGNSTVARYKAQITMKNKYGVSYTLESEKLRNKANKTLTERIGDNKTMYYDEITKKRNITKMKNYLSDYSNHDKNYDLGMLYAALRDNGVDAVGSFKNLNKLWVLTINNTNIIIDFDDNRKKNYNLYKSLLAEYDGYRYLQIFPWDNLNKIIGILLPKYKISADSCQIWHLKLDVTNDFLDKYDLQGRCRNQLLCLGLVKDGEILQVMTFGKSVYDKNHNIVIRRMCTKFGFDVIGGYHKMLHYATEMMELYDIMVYVDIAKCDKSLYENLDMSYIKRNPPRKVWFKDSDYIGGNYKLDYYNRVYLSKNKDFVDSGKSYEDYMFDNGWHYSYDCGQYLFEY